MKIKYKTVIVIWAVLATVVLTKDIIASQTFEKDKRKSAYNLEKGEYPFVVKVWPKSAKIKIMNIGPKYVEGMILPVGKYDLKLYKSGYETKRLWVKHNDEEPHKIRLSRRG
mgnify:CR=1 FL=1